MPLLQGFAKTDGRNLERFAVFRNRAACNDHTLFTEHFRDLAIATGAYPFPVHMEVFVEALEKPASQIVTKPSPSSSRGLYTHLLKALTLTEYRSHLK